MEFTFAYPAPEHRLLLLRNPERPIRVSSNDVWGFDRIENLCDYFEHHGGDVIVVSSADYPKLAPLAHLIHGSALHGIIVVGNEAYDLKSSPKYTLSLSKSDRPEAILNGLNNFVELLRLEKRLKEYEKRFGGTLDAQSEFNNNLTT